MNGWVGFVCWDGGMDRWDGSMGWMDGMDGIDTWDRYDE